MPAIGGDRMVVGGVTSIIIPCHNHARYVTDAVASALAQTAVPVDVIVVDDGSTDDVPAALAPFLCKDGEYFDPDRHIRLYRIEHAGPSAARNRGLEASIGEFVMFLDADDVIAPTKVEEQLAAMTPEIGWVICDVDIEDGIRRIRETASQRYRYEAKDIGGWIRPLLEPSNFIPLMSPLIRRVLLDPADDTPLRFGDRHPEDWHFLYGVAGRGRVKYLPRVLATYRKRPGSRNAQGIPNQKPSGGPLILNLGCGSPGALSWHPIADAVNLDKSMGWCFEHGLGDYRDGTVDGITISHALMYVHDDDWRRVFLEFARVLKPGGVIRITEDDTVNPASSRHGGWRGSEPAIVQTCAIKVLTMLRSVGILAREVAADESRLPVLCQAQHGAPPHVFFVEGFKP